MKGNTLNGLCFLLIPMILSSCSFVLKKDGLKDIRLNDKFLSADQITWNRGTPRDTSFSEAGYTWRGVILPLEEGYVLVEEDFFTDNRVNRIRVVSPLYRTRSKIQVGDEVQKLSGITGPWILTPIPEYGVLDISSESLPSFHYLVEYNDNGSFPSSFEQLDASQKIVGIVIM